MQKTQNYQLNQYEPQDSFLRTDFNADNQKIDAALKGLYSQVKAKADQTALTQGLAKKCQAWFGSYTGDGTKERVLSLGFAPKAVIVKKPDNYDTYGHTSEIDYAPAMAFQGVQGNTLNVTPEGFRVTDHGLVNNKGTTYIYIAFA